MRITKHIYILITPDKSRGIGKVAKPYLFTSVPPLLSLGGGCGVNEGGVEGVETR
jgi:hypothetical protein